ncbi:putative inorganic polyphosphate/ATP-NAD kinase [Anatilimnocola aggregata]|uniref:NAD kinase n=1 Tax=Anatilimnocola aggregata TaxID=2528021 RepID=A0A517YLC0_9BACT|nr:NAD(+)/NADH kinase [Anatilimnocola aggregata]QDU30998.1 putative inorganic polyphosphate/ATP-NAD kinase [Anatilimnocola aggregata]
MQAAFSADETPAWKNTAGRRPRVMLLGSGDRPNVLAGAAEIRPLVSANCELVHEDFHYRPELALPPADFAVVLGGDGSILRAAKLMGSNQLPIMGINMGKLGFLAWHSPQDVAERLPNVAQGNCRVVEHLMFHCSLVRKGAVLERHLGLNEAVIASGFPFTLLNVHLYVDGELATTYSCDGLIISTPVGSTAHSLSAGGPILRSTLAGFVICPISPHTLTVRPVVDTAERIYEMEVLQPNEGTSLVVDGRVIGPLLPGDRVRVERADSTFKLIASQEHSYYHTLQDKLGWAGNIYRK